MRRRGESRPKVRVKAIKNLTTFQKPLLMTNKSIKMLLIRVSMKHHNYYPCQVNLAAL